MKNPTNLSRRLALLPLALLAFTAAQAQRVVTVTLPAGKTSVTLKGEIKGDASVDYVISAKAGQTLTVTLRPSKGSPEFNLLPPGSESAMVNSSIQGRGAVSRMIPADGKYRIRVYQMRATARRGATAGFNLTVGLKGTALPALSASADARVAGTAFNATAEVSMTNSLYPDLKTVKAGVIRRGRDGTATVVFSFKGQQRTVLFIKGKAVASDAMDQVSSSTAGDEVTVRIGTDETYRFPLAFLKGG